METEPAAEPVGEMNETTAPALVVSGTRAGGLQLRTLVRGASALSGSVVVSSALSVVAGFVAARWLSPSDYGTAQTVLLMYFLASLVRSGVFEGGVRNSIELRARNEPDQADAVVRVAVWTEGAVSLVPGLVLAGVALTMEDSLTRTGMLLAPATVLAASVAAFLGGLTLARERFGVVAQAGMVRGIAFPAAVVAFVAGFGAVGLIVAPLAADLIASAFYLRRSPDLRLRPMYDSAIARSAVRVGFPLGAAAIVYWLYRSVGSVSVAIGDDASTFAFYAFAAALITVSTRAVASMQTVLTPRLWSTVSQPGVETTWERDAARAIIVIAALAGLVTNLLQGAFGPLVHLVVPQYQPSIEMFDLLAFNVLLLSATAVPSLILDAPTINRQVRHLGCWITALAVNVGANALTYAIGFGVMAVIANDLWIQLALGVTLLHLARVELGPTWPLGEVRRALLLIVVVSAVIGAVLHATMPSHKASSIGWVVIAAARLLAAGGCWALAGALGWRVLRGGPLSGEP